MKNDFKSILKYPGGKEKELPIISKYLPDDYNNYYEPFVGGGAVFLHINAKKYYINDKSTDLIALYEAIKKRDPSFYDYLSMIDYNWKLLHNISKNNEPMFLTLFHDFRDGILNKSELSDRISEFVFHNANLFNGMLDTKFNYRIDNFVSEIKKCLINKFKRMVKLENSSQLRLFDEDITSVVETAFKQAFYTHFRMLYNNKNKLKVRKGFAPAVYLFIRDVCYSSMFRYNKNGDFNVPYGGMSYNNKEFLSRLSFYKNDKLLKKMQNSVIENLDFYDFVKKHPCKKGDFIFLDPPYDTEFNTYDKNSFSYNDQTRLREYLVNECKGNFMLVIKNSKLISALYKDGEPCANGNSLTIRKYDKKYQVSFMNRNDKNVEHLLITNY